GTAAFHYDVRNMFRKWTTDLRDGQRRDGAYPDVAPDVLGQLGPAQFGNAGWADAGVICPWKIYWHYGDRQILEENYPAMVRWIEYQRQTSMNLIRPRTAYGDWLAIDAVTPQNAPVPCDLVGTAYFAHSTDLMARIADVLGRSADSVQNQSGQQGFGGRTGESGDFHIAEAVEGEARGPLFGAAAPADVGVGGLGGAKVFAVDVAVGLQHLGKLQGDNLTAAAADF
ncbi:MAG: hypothetical protein EBV34_20770, partial [Betaproteobacteria bacterium]|nr:hypothetical protein [Betaproteobacteria bacterium]